MSFPEGGENLQHFLKDIFLNSGKRNSFSFPISYMSEGKFGPIFQGKGLAWELGDFQADEREDPG